MWTIFLPRRDSRDQGRGLACVKLIAEAERRPASSTHDPRQHEPHVDPRIADRFGDPEASETMRPAVRVIKI
jgi:hypothetical protein